MEKMLNSNIIHKIYNFNNYNIEVLDNVFTLDERTKFYYFFRSSNFKIGWEDSIEIELQNFKSMHSVYSKKDLEDLTFANQLCKTQFGKNLFTNYNIDKCVLNLSKPGDIYFNHTHTNKKVLLYYANIRWHEEWSGETMFYNDSFQEILFASPYIPGRLIYFDGCMPHAIRPQTTIAPHYRFTFTLFLDEK